MKHTVISTAVLLCVLCAAAFSSCGTETPPQTDTPVSDIPETETVTEKTQEELTSSVEAEDFGGRDFTVLAGNAIGQNFPYYEVLAEEETGDTLNDAVFARNLWMENKFNIRIVPLQIEPGGGAFLSVFQKNANAGDHTFDIALMAPTDAFKAAVNKYLYPLDELKEIDKTKPWWCQYFNEAASVKGYNYFLGGDMNLSLFDAAGIVYFNKTVQQNCDVEDLYDLAESGKFTVDKFLSLCRDVTQDIDGDGVIGDADLIGFRGNTYSFQMFFCSFNEKLISKDESDLLSLNTGAEVTDRILRAIEIMNDTPYVQQPNLEEVGFPAFKSNLALFLTQPAYQLSVLRDMESDYGMIPLPKYDLEQENYYSQIHTTWSSVTAVPITISENDISMTGKLIEDFAYSSHLYIRPAFYDVMLHSKYARDERSPKMLDLIFDHVTLDFAYLMAGYGKMNFDDQTRKMSGNGDTGVASFLEKHRTDYSAVIDSVNENW